MIYLDNNASTKIYPEAIEAMVEAMESNANAGAPHTAGRKMRKIIEDSRVQVAKLVGAKPEQLVFMSGATEANNMALRGGGETLCLVSAMEHPSVKFVHPNTEVIPVDEHGIVDLKWLDNRLSSEKPGTVIVSIMYASHETGVLQPVKEVAKITSKHLQRCHLDAVQGAGKDYIDFTTLGVQSISIGGHKMGAVQGIGALIYDSALNLIPLIRGGGQEKSQRPGTPNAPGAASFAVAAEKCFATMDEKMKRLNFLREYMERIITERYQQVIVASKEKNRLAGTSRFILPGVPSEKQVMFMDLNGVCVSAGAACSSGVVKPSASLIAMGYSEELAGSSIRVGMSWATTQEDIDVFLDTYEKMVNTLVK